MAGTDLSPTLNKSGQTGPAPVSHQNHKRHDKFARLRHSDEFLAFLNAQATRLTSTAAVIFTKVEKYGATRVAGAPNLAAIP